MVFAFAGKARTSVKRYRDCIGTIVTFASMIAFVGAVSETSADSILQKLNSPTKVSPTDSGLLATVESIAEVHKIRIQLDPRVDPHAVVQPPKVTLPLGELVSRLALEADAVARPFGECVLITPRSDNDRIATLASIRESELVAKRVDRASLDKLRPFALGSSQEPRTPNELLSEIWRRGRLEGSPPELPHDLWVAELHRVTTAEALAFVLVPMGYAFEWNGDSIRLTPLPEILAVERTHRLPPGRSSDDLVVDLRALFKPLDEALGRPPRLVESTETSIRFSGTADEHEQFRRLLHPPTTAQPTNANKRYTLRVDDKPARAVLDALVAQGVPIVYDEASLAAAGIDLTQRISIDVDSLSANGVATELASQLSCSVVQRESLLVLVASE